jgi:hypothetical protein
MIRVVVVIAVAVLVAKRKSANPRKNRKRDMWMSAGTRLTTTSMCHLFEPSYKN